MKRVTYKIQPQISDRIPPWGLAVQDKRRVETIKQQKQEHSQKIDGSRRLQQAARERNAPLQLQASRGCQETQALRFPQKPDSILRAHAPKGNPNPIPIPISSCRFVSIISRNL